MQEKVVNAKPFEYTMSLISGKWKLNILFWLWKKEIMRYVELKRALGNITHKMFSNQLKELETGGIIIRKEYPQVPSKVEYKLSIRGTTLMPVLQDLCSWGEAHLEDVFLNYLDIKYTLTSIMNKNKEGGIR